MKKRIWLSPPHMSGEENEFINKAFQDNFIAPAGPNLDSFEAELESYYSNKKFITVLNSGTSAIHLALKLIGVEAGDEVICQSKTFTASANPIIYEKGIPIFVDSEGESYNISPKLLEKAINSRIKNGRKPKAIIAVHLYGMPYKVEEIQRIADHFNIPVVEDSAEALGSSFKSKQCGAFGEYGILSFNGNKIITTSSGGALINQNKKLKDRTLYLATQANDSETEFHHVEVGYNYRMSNVLAGIGLGQMKILSDRITQKREIYNTYKNELEAYDKIEFSPEPKDCFSNRWLSTILTDSKKTRDGMINALKNENIEARRFWKPLHLQPVFKSYPNFLNGVSEDLYQRGVCLPSGTNMDDNDMERILTTIKNSLD